MFIKALTQASSMAIILTRAFLYFHGLCTSFSPVSMDAGTPVPACKNGTEFRFTSHPDRSLYP